MALLAILWIGGLVAYFLLTDERQRENTLLIAWIVMALPVVYGIFRLLLGP